MAMQPVANNDMPSSRFSSTLRGIESEQSAPGEPENKSLSPEVFKLSKPDF